MPNIQMQFVRRASEFAAFRNLMWLTAIIFLIGGANLKTSAQVNYRAQTIQNSQASCGDGWDERFAAGGANGAVLATAVDAAGNLYIGGEFTQVGNVAANHVAKWNGAYWSALGAGADDYVGAIAVFGGDVYVGGEFKTAGGAAASHIAKWNGFAWSALGGGTNENVAALAVSNGDLYAGGYFTTAGGAAANYIAKWNGTGWSPLGSGTESVVNALAVSGNDVYAGGFFTAAGGASANHVARWNGTNWSPLGAGTDGDVYALAASGNNIYVGGDFSKAGDVNDTIHVAGWDGAAWSALGKGTNNTVLAIAVSGGNVYASGFFTAAGAVAANRISRWNGAAWSALDAGTNGAVVALAARGGDVYAGGYFSSAGCRASQKIARYFSQSFAGASGGDWHTAANWTNGNLPAADSGVNISAADATISIADATIRDLRVDEGRTLTVAANRTLTVSGNLDLLGNIAGAGTLVVTDCSPSAITRAANAGYIRLALTRCVNYSGAFDFPVGTANGYSPVLLSNIIGAGSFTVKPNEGAYAGAANGLAANRLRRFWNLTNGGITSAGVKFTYLANDVNGTEAVYGLFRINNGAAENVAATINTTNHTATAANVSNFSPWTLAEFSPPAASLSIQGRVLTAAGGGVGNAVVVMTGADGASRYRYAMTNPFGYYRFADVAAGASHTFSVRHKQFTFEPRTVSLTQDAVDFNFTANP